MQFYRIIVEVTMRCGLVYRTQIFAGRIDEQGNPVGDLYQAMMEASICDTDGNLLYSVDEEMYR